ncbi:MAG: VOC family protein [Euryarchaeota archaeon]|nr:VOC family protein [Euryarchaeota archaeon]
MAAMEGSIVHVELHSSDPAKTKQFYSNVFGWKFKDLPEMNYMLWTAANEPGGGLMKTVEGRPPMVLDYVLSKNINASLQKVQASGGMVLQPKTEIPNQGWWALFQEPGGTVMALYQNMPQSPPPKPAAKKAAKGKKKK